MDCSTEVSKSDYSALSWQIQLRSALRRPADLYRRLGLDEASLPAALVAAKSFPVLVTEHYLNLIRKADPADPLLLQILPTGQELKVHVEELRDPLNEGGVKLGQGLLRKYSSRALSITTSTCAIHCRYCFRKAFPYEDHVHIDRDWHKEFEQIRKYPEIDEMILSGGDPLTLSNVKLASIIAATNRYPQIRVLRIHTRIPVVLPDRIEQGLLDTLRAFEGDQIVMVIHANHPREVDSNVKRACEKLQSAGFMLLNQSVLLKGVNDDAQALIALSQALIRVGVKPYYLHLLDRVVGTTHFFVDDTKARHLIVQMQEKLPGYAVPNLVREVAGAVSKVRVL